MDEFIKTLKENINYQLNYWDPDQFNWDYSWVLCKYCHKYFNLWWNPDKFNFNFNSEQNIKLYNLEYLFRYCIEHIKTWFPEIVKRQSSLTDYLPIIVEYTKLVINSQEKRNNLDEILIKMYGEVITSKLEVIKEKITIIVISEVYNASFQNKDLLTIKRNLDNFILFNK